MQLLGHDVDVTHASPELVTLLSGYFTAKTGRRVDETMSYFASEMAYVDATLGWSWHGWAELHAAFGEYMPNWADTAQAYPTAVLGDTGSAVVRFTDTPELFGHEIRGIAAISFTGGKISRWVDYWDGRQFTLDGIAGQRLPAGQFPSDLGEGLGGDSRTAAIQPIAHRVAAALSAAEPAAAVELFSDDVVLEDLSLRTTITGRRAVARYLDRSLPHLPYGAGSKVRHVLGGASGGGFEWISGSGPVPHGIVAVSADGTGVVDRLSAAWDASLLTDDALGRLQALGIDR
ncbi:hypothetical protein [Lentzea sp. NPDC060358]|uniref:hypothetical protein n=1 Tax=Lentzea sp. NPDC060358 TaxID=3347103 RepID=UPI003654BB1F